MSLTTDVKKKKKNITELKDRAIEIIQSELQNRKKKEWKPQGNLDFAR